MLGPDQTFTSEIRGIIPRTIEYLFAMMSREQRKVCFSFFFFPA